MKLIYVINGNSHDVNWILPLGFKLTWKLEEADLVWLTGGEDWDSCWYDCENPHESIGSNLQRDVGEMELIKIALNQKIPIGGTCRGSQILPVLVDPKRGRIVNHQNNPSFIHMAKTYDGLTIPVSSTHHQAAYPYNLIEGKEYRLLAWSEGILKYRYLDETTMDLEKPETEVVVYPNTGGGLIGFQNHAEFEIDRHDHIESIKWYRRTLLKFLAGGFRD